MARRRQNMPRAKETVSFEFELDDKIKVPFATLQEKFCAYADKKGIDLAQVKITDKGINGTFTDSAGITYDVDFKPSFIGSHLQGKISKPMQSLNDAVQTGTRVSEFTSAMIEKKVQPPLPHLEN